MLSFFLYCPRRVLSLFPIGKEASEVKLHFSLFDLCKYIGGTDFNRQRPALPRGLFLFPFDSTNTTLEFEVNHRKLYYPAFS